VNALWRKPETAGAVLTLSSFFVHTLPSAFSPTKILTVGSTSSHNPVGLVVSFHCSISLALRPCGLFPDFGVRRPHTFEFLNVFSQEEFSVLMMEFYGLTIFFSFLLRSFLSYANLLFLTPLRFFWFFLFTLTTRGGSARMGGSLPLGLAIFSPFGDGLRFFELVLFFSGK